METIKAIIVFSVLSFCLFSSCDNDNILPNNTTKQTFDEMYPGAKRVEWEAEKGYYVVDFRHGGYEKEAWFDSEGVWLMTETNYERNPPQIIKDVLSKSDYYDWHIDNVDYIEALNKESVYIVEVEKGQQEMDLYFSKNGKLLNANESDGNHRSTPL